MMENHEGEPSLRVVVHAGADKSGSTSIQGFFFDNRSDLCMKGILYPETGLRREIFHHKDLSTCVFDEPPTPDLIEEPHIPLLPRPDFSYHEYARQLRDECRSHKVHTVLISSEALFHPIYNEIRLSRFRALLPSSEVEIVVILRNTSDWVQSRWAHQVRHRKGFRFSPKEFTDLLRDSGQLDFDARLALLAKVFGTERLRVVFYDDVRTNLIQEFCSVARIQINPLLYRRAAVKNVSPSWRTISCLFRANQRALLQSRRRQLCWQMTRLYRLLPMNRRGTTPFPPCVVAMLEEHWQACRATIIARYGVTVRQA